MSPEDKARWNRRFDEIVEEFETPPLEAIELGNTQLDPGQTASTFEELCGHLAENVNRDAALVEAGEMTVEAFDQKW